MMNFLFIFLNKYKNIVMIAVIALLSVCIIIVCMHFYSDSDKKENVSDTTTRQQVITDDTDDTLSGDSTILVVCNSETIGEAVFMALLDFQIVSEKIIVTPLDMSVSDGTKTYAESYSYGGIDNLLASIESVRKCNIDRYVTINKDGISSLTDTLGPVNLYVPEEYVYESSDKSYIVDAGYNDLESAMLYTFLKINSGKEYGINKFAQLLCTIINSYLENIDVSDAQALFGELCNCVNTDITIADYYSCSSDIEYLLNHNARCVVFNEGE